MWFGKVPTPRGVIQSPLLLRNVEYNGTRLNRSSLLRVWYTQLNPWFWIQIQKIAGPTVKNHVWYKGFKWGFKSQLEFLCGSHSKFEFSLQLFLNPVRIQIRTQFFCGSQFLPLLGPPNSFLPFSLSLLHCFSASLSLSSRPLQTRPRTPFLSQTP